MTAVTDIVIINIANSRNILLRAVKPFKDKKSQPSIDVPLVNTSAASRIIFRFTGQAQDISFSFALFDDGVDVSGGTNPSAIITPSEQEQYLMDTIFTEEFDTTWTLVFDPGSPVQPFDGSITGTIEDIDIDHSNPSVFTGTLFFKRGILGTL